jgi:hypothetical protein
MMKRLLHVVSNFTARFALLCGFGLASLLPLYAHQSTEQAIDSTAANTSADQTADSDVPAAPTPQFSSKSTVLLKFCRNSHAAYLWRTPPNLRAFLRHAGRPDRTRIGGSRGPSKKHSSGMGTGRCRLRHASGLSLWPKCHCPHCRSWRGHRGPRGLAVSTPNKTGVWRRTKHAVIGTFVSRTPSGGQMPAISRFVGVYSAAFIANAWEPPSQDSSSKAW